MHRRLLAGILGTMSALALALVATAFLSTMAPNDKTNAALPRVSTASIPNEGFAYIPHVWDMQDPKTEVLLVRNASGTLSAWLIPTEDGARRLPDGHWWRSGYPCKNLVPDFRAGLISCQDDELAQWKKERFRWTIEGKSLRQSVPDLQPAQGTEEGGFFVFHKSGAA